MILIAVGLFATLSYTVAQMMRSGNAEIIGDQQAGILADEILTSARQYRQAIQTVRIANGCEAEDISFENTVVAGYTNGTDTSCQVFHSDGGGLSYIAPSEELLDTAQAAKLRYGEWYFIGESCVYDIGTGGTNCFSDGVDNEDLVLVMPWIKKPICDAINEKLDISTTVTPQANNQTWAVAMPKFTGTFSEGGHAIQSGNNDVTLLQGKPVGCFEGEVFPQTGTYHFYQVLTAR